MGVENFHRLTEVDPRLEVDAQIAAALQVVVNANPAGVLPVPEYTQEQLEAILFHLSVAMMQLKKLPGGKEALARVRRNAEAALAQRRADRSTCDGA